MVNLSFDRDSVISAVKNNLPIDQVLSKISVSLPNQTITGIYSSVISRYESISSLSTGTTIANKAKELINKEVNSGIKSSLVSQLRGLLSTTQIQGIVDGYANLPSPFSFTQLSSSTLSTTITKVRDIIR